MTARLCERVRARLSGSASGRGTGRDVGRGVRSNALGQVQVTNIYIRNRV